MNNKSICKVMNDKQLFLLFGYFIGAAAAFVSVAACTPKNQANQNAM